MLKMRMGTILMGPEGYRRFIIDLNNRSGGSDLDPDAVIDDAAQERAMSTTLGSISDILGNPNEQYEGVVQANAAANLGAGMLLISLL